MRRSSGAFDFGCLVGRDGEAIRAVVVVCGGAINVECIESDADQAYRTQRVVLFK